MESALCSFNLANEVGDEVGDSALKLKYSSCCSTYNGFQFPLIEYYIKEYDSKEKVYFTPICIAMRFKVQQ